jgi:hypothetical protein
MSNATYAYFQGTGPAGATCGGCVHCTRIDKETVKVYCYKARLFVGRDKPTKAIKASSAACKYFVAKPA